MIYLTWGIGFNGIYLSQVIGVCKYMAELDEKPVKLISFVPYPSFKKLKGEIKRNYSNCIVLPMIPSRNHWWPLFSFMLMPILIFLSERKIMTRGVIANQIGLLFKNIHLIKTVIFDGRGAEKAELTEYDLGQNEAIKKKINTWENRSVNKSDFRLAVSHKLVDYWRNEYSYSGLENRNHIVVPCTINPVDKTFTNEQLLEARLKYNYSPEDIILVYSGSAESWQSFQLIDKLLSSILDKNENVKVLFLAKIELENLESYQKYMNRISKMWLSPMEVNNILNFCDYGLLLRENSVTNQVASPTKFAEYLAAGLKVIISENVGDFSNLVKTNDIGYVIKDDFSSIYLSRITIANSESIKDFANKRFEKNTFQKEYNLILEL